MDQQNNISAVAPEMSVNKPSTPGPKLGKILIPLAVLVLLCIGYGVLAKNYNWWPHSSSSIKPSPLQTFKTESREQEEKLLTERQWLVVVAEQYFQVYGKLPLTMAELNKDAATLTAEELEFLAKNFSWRLDSNKEVEVCIIPTLQFHSGGQCQTLAQVNAELSNWKTYQNNQYYFQYPPDHTVYTTTRYDASWKKEVLVPADETSTAVSVAENTDSKYVFGGENITLTFTIYEYQDQLSDSKKAKEANSTYLGYPAKITRGAGNLGEEYLTIEMYLDKFIIRVTQGAKSELLDTVLKTFRVDQSTRIEP